MNPSTINSQPSTDFSEARELQWMWKSPAMAAMAVSVCKLALARGSQEEFSANDLPEFGHGGQGIAGSVFYRLLHDEIVYQVGHFGADQTFYPKVVKNKGGNKVNVYRLKSARRAEALLRVHRAVAHGTGETLTQAELPANDRTERPGPCSADVRCNHCGNPAKTKLDGEEWCKECFAEYIHGAIDGQEHDASAALGWSVRP